MKQISKESHIDYFHYVQILDLIDVLSNSKGANLKELHDLAEGLRDKI